MGAARSSARFLTFDQPLENGDAINALDRTERVRDNMLDQSSGTHTNTFDHGLVRSADTLIFNIIAYATKLTNMKQSAEQMTRLN